MSTGRTMGDQFLREVVVGSSHGVFAVDVSGAIVFSNGVLESTLGFDSEEIHGERIDDLGDGQLLDRVRDAATDSPGTGVAFTLEDRGGEQVRLAATCETTEFDGSRYFTVWFQEQILGESGPTGGPSSERDTLTPVPVEDLTELGRDLLRTEDPAGVAETGLAAVERILGTDVACIRLFDEGTNDFDRVATTERGAELLASRPTFDLNRSLAGRAFRRGEPVLDRPDGPGDAVDRANLHVPLDGEGTLTVFGTGGGLGTRAVELAEQLATLLGATLARTRADSNGAQPPGGVGAAYELPMGDIVSDATEAETPEGIGRRICDRLVATDVYSGAWFVTTDIDGEWRALEASAGETEAPPEAVRRTRTDVDSGSDDPTCRAIETGDVCVVRNQQTVENGGPGTNGDSQPDRRVETVVVVPVSHVDRTYGVFVLRADPGSVDPRARSELDVLGDVVGLATYAAESKKLLLSEKVQQLEFEVTDPDCLAVVVSEATGAVCEIEHQTLTNDGDHLCYVQVEGASPESAREATAAVETVTDCRIVEVGDDGCLLEVLKTRSGAEAMMDVGATVRRATAEEGVGTLIVETPLSADVREVVDAYTAMNPESRLVAKREIDRPVPTTESLTGSLEDVLTDRQHSVLTAAYYAGYFDWPRANTAEEIADSLGISPATLHQHLRAAERKLLDLVCDEQAHLHER